MKRIHLRRIILYYLLLMILVVPGIQSNLYAETDPFPLYPSMAPNVEFWKKIYSYYSVEEGVIHDKKKLDIIYGVIDLKHPDLRGSRKINRDRIKKAKKAYKAILRKLAQGAAPTGPEEQRVAGLFGPDARKEDFKKASRNLRCQVPQRRASAEREPPCICAVRAYCWWRTTR